MSFEVTVDTKEVESWLASMQRGTLKELRTANRLTTIYGLRKTKETIAKRSGAMRKSYKWRSMDSLGLINIIESPLKYADHNEFGFSRGEVLPRRKKYLWFPVRKDAARLDGGIRQAQFAVYWKALSDATSEGADNPFAVATERSGIVRTKRSAPAKYAGSHIMQDKVMPDINHHFELQINDAMDRILNG